MESLVNRVSPVSILSFYLYRAKILYGGSRRKQKQNIIRHIFRLELYNTSSQYISIFWFAQYKMPAQISILSLLWHCAFVPLAGTLTWSYFYSCNFCLVSTRSSCSVSSRMITSQHLRQMMRALTKAGMVMMKMRMTWCPLMKRAKQWARSHLWRCRTQAATARSLIQISSTKLTASPSFREQARSLSQPADPPQNWVSNKKSLRLVEIAPNPPSSKSPQLQMTKTNLEKIPRMTTTAMMMTTVTMTSRRRGRSSSPQALSQKMWMTLRLSAAILLSMSDRRPKKNFLSRSR